MLQWGSSLGLLSNTYSIHNALGDKRNPPVFNAFIRVTFEPTYNYAFKVIISSHIDKRYFLCVMIIIILSHFIFASKSPTISSLFISIDAVGSSKIKTSLFSKNTFKKVSA